MKWIKTITFLVSAVVAQPSYADFNDVTWGGFLTQGLVYTDANNFAGESENQISTDFREAAIYGLWRPTSHLRLGTQVIARELGDMTDDSPQIDYLSADYSFSNDPSYDVGIRIGKLKVPYGFYNDTREVPFTRSSILLPQSMYFDQTRDFQLSAMGVALYGFSSFENYRIEQELLLGQPRNDEVSEYAFFNNDLSGSFGSTQGIVYRAALNDAKDQWRVNTTLSKYSLKYTPGPLGELGLVEGDIGIKLFTVGGHYSFGQLSFTSEYSRHFIDPTALKGLYSLVGRQTYEAYYLQGDYRFSNRTNLILRYDVVYRDVNDRYGLKKQLLFGVPAHTQWSKDITLGAGWAATSSLLLRAEWHHIRGAARVPEQDNPNMGATKKRWNMFLLQAAYRF